MFACYSCSDWLFLDRRTGQRVLQHFLHSDLLGVSFPFHRHRQRERDWQECRGCVRHSGHTLRLDAPALLRQSGDTDWPFRGHDLQDVDRRHSYLLDHIQCVPYRLLAGLLLPVQGCRRGGQYPRKLSGSFVPDFSHDSRRICSITLFSNGLL